MNISIERKAYHEAGHVIAHWYFCLDVSHVNIIGNGDDLGSTGGITIEKIEAFGKDNGEDETKELARKAVITFLAGVEVVRIFSYINPNLKMNGLDIVEGGDTDALIAFDIIGKWFQCNKETTTVKNKKTSEFFNDCKEKANKILDKNWEAVEVIAKELINHKELHEDEIKEILDPFKIKRIETFINAPIK